MNSTKRIVLCLFASVSLCWGLIGDTIQYQSSENGNTYTLSVYSPPIILKKGVLDKGYDKKNLQWFNAYNAYSRISDFKDRGHEEWKKGFSSDFLKDFPINEELFSQYLKRGPSEYQNPVIASVLYVIEINSKYLVMGIAKNSKLDSSPMEPIAGATVIISSCDFIKEDNVWKFTRDYYGDINFTEYKATNINELISKYKLIESK